MAIKACPMCKGLMSNMVAVNSLTVNPIDSFTTIWRCPCGHQEPIDVKAVTKAKSVLDTNLAEANVQELIRSLSGLNDALYGESKLMGTPYMYGDPKPAPKEFALPPLPKTGTAKIPSFTSKPVTTVTLDKQNYEDLIHYARKALKFIAHIPLDSPAFNMKTAREAHDLVHCLMQAIGTLTGERNGEV